MALTKYSVSESTDVGGVVMGVLAVPPISYIRGLTFRKSIKNSENWCLESASLTYWLNISFDHSISVFVQLRFTLSLLTT